MRADRLSLLIDQAALKARSSNLGQARDGAAAFVLAGKVRLIAAADPRTAAIVAHVLQVVWLVEAPSTLPSRDPETGRKVSDEQLAAAVKTCGSIKEIAAQNDCHPRTVARRLKTLTGHGLTDVQFAGAPSLRRSKAIKRANAK
jgi:hypothetical protein